MLTVLEAKRHNSNDCLEPTFFYNLTLLCVWQRFLKLTLYIG